MNVVSSDKNNKGYMSGLASALTVLNLPTVVWDKKTKPTPDMLVEAKPKVLFCCSEDIDDKFCVAVEKYRGRVYKDLKVVVIGGFIKNLKADLVCTPNDVSEVMVKNLPCHHIPFLESANIAQICGGEYNEKYKADLLLVSDEEISPEVLEQVNCLKGLKIKIVGKNPIPSPYYLGHYVSYKNLSSLFMSSKCYIGDKYYNDAYYNKSQSVHFAGFLNCKGYESDFIYHIKEDKLRNKHIKEERQLVINNLTFFHRLREIFIELNMQDELKICQDKLGELK